jgi:hypothetical protein
LGGGWAGVGTVVVEEVAGESTEGGGMVAGAAEEVAGVGGGEEGREGAARAGARV